MHNELRQVICLDDTFSLPLLYAICVYMSSFRGAGYCLHFEKKKRIWASDSWASYKKGGKRRLTVTAMWGKSGLKLYSCPTRFIFWQGSWFRGWCLFLGYLSGRPHRTEDEVFWQSTKLAISKLWAFVRTHGVWKQHTKNLAFNANHWVEEKERVLGFLCKRRQRAQFAKFVFNLLDCQQSKCKNNNFEARQWPSIRESERELESICQSLFSLVFRTTGFVSHRFLPGLLRATSSPFYCICICSIQPIQFSPLFSSSSLLDLLSLSREDSS